jgi:hypothetical protein
MLFVAIAGVVIALIVVIAVYGHRSMKKRTGVLEHRLLQLEAEFAQELDITAMTTAKVKARNREGYASEERTQEGLPISPPALTDRAAPPPEQLLPPAQPSRTDRNDRTTM